MLLYNCTSVPVFVDIDTQAGHGRLVVMIVMLFSSAIITIILLSHLSVCCTFGENIVINDSLLKLFDTLVPIDYLGLVINPNEYTN